MKKALLILSAVITLLLVVSCNQDYEEIANTANFEKSFTRGDFYVPDIDFSNLDTTYYVTDKDVEAYIHFKKLLAESEKKEFSVEEMEPLSLKDGVTLGYLLNYNEGWEIISADKRCPLVLASSDEGTLNIDELPEGVLTWIHSLESDVLYMRSIHGIPNGINEEQSEKIQASLDFWGSILPTQDFIEDHSDPSVSARIIDGYWELISTEVTYSDSISSTKLIGPPYYQFHQDTPYNSYCPVISWSSSDHAPAGCVAIAGSMMLGFLNNKFSFPRKGPIIACYSGTIDSPEPFTCVMDNNNAAIWNNLGIPNYAATLIAYVGHLVNMHYGATDSSASMEDLVDNVFGDFGISCDYNTFSSSEITNSLLNGMPVLISAYGSRSYENGIWQIRDGHVFIVDSYMTVTATYKYTYVWRYTGPGLQPYPDPEPLYQTLIVSNEIDSYRMSWGWNNQYLDHLPFAISGNWEIYDNGDTFNYIYERYMINNFTIN